MSTRVANPSRDPQAPRWGRLFARLYNGESGVAMVEFALVLPILLLLVTGIVEFGLMFNKYISVTDAARIGARELALSRGSSGNPCTAEETTLENNEPTLNLSAVNFTPAPTFSNAADNCTNPGSWNQGDAVTFHIQVPFTFDLLFGFKVFTVNMTAQATDAIE